MGRGSGAVNLYALKSHFNVNWPMKSYCELHCKIMVLGVRFHMTEKTIGWYESTTKQELHLNCFPFITLKLNWGGYQHGDCIHSLCSLPSPSLSTKVSVSSV